MPAPKIIKKKPSEKEMEKMRQNDQDYVLAGTDAVEFLKGRRQAVYNIARNYHLDPEELMQEAYEVLLTCLRDYTPVYEKEEGKFITVQFTTFFGNRMESRGMEMRNRDPEYQARQAYTDGMSQEEKGRFRANPPLLVQHLDQESTMQEQLRSEVAEAKQGEAGGIKMKVARDSFFERKLNELVANEKDEKKRAALLHVKVGGVYNFQEMAYHFGVTDSRASQVMNELMDAFYVQRLIDRSVSSVAYDFKKLKFNDKRVLRLVHEALKNAPEERAAEIVEVFKADFESLVEDYAKISKQLEKEKKQPEARPRTTRKAKTPPPAYEEIFSDEENDDYPLVSVEVRPIDKLQFIDDVHFRSPAADDELEEFVETFNADDASMYPALVSEEGYVIDGEHRIKAAIQQGKSEYLCITRRIAKDVDRRIMRVVVNLRLRKPDKLELYYAISALADLGLSQQRIADYINISRTNVLVYAKVRDKAAPKIRALFEDGLIQITNASACVDLDDDAQAAVADFIRKYGIEWSKGNNFNTLHLAAMEGKLAELEAKQKPATPTTVDVPTASDDVVAGGDVSTVSNRAVQAMHQRIESYEQALKDAEVWSSQREKVINNQTELLEQAQAEIEELKKELDAAELMKFGSSDVIEAELKALKAYYNVTERLSGATHGVQKAMQDMKKLDLSRKQGLELTDMLEKLDQAMNELRVEMLNRGYKQTLATPKGSDED